MRYLHQALLTIVIAAFAHTAQAQEPTLGTGLICDTRDQLESVVALANETEDYKASIERVNALAGSTAPACAVAQVAYLRLHAVGQTRTSDGLQDLVQIAVVGIVVANEFRRVAQPVLQFTLFKAEGSDV
jgi:hypothetical protein